MKPETYSFDSARFAGFARWLVVAVFLAAGSFALAWLTATPAQARGGINSDTNPELPDSDNLDFTGTGGQDYTARSFGIQYYSDSYDRGGTAACTGNSVFDGFAQTSAMSGGRVEDFPTVNHNTGTVRRNTALDGNPCAVFVAQQDLAVSQMIAKEGYHLRLNNTGDLVLAPMAPPSRARVGQGLPLTDSGRVDRGEGRDPAAIGLVANDMDGSLSANEIPFTIEIQTDSSSTRSGYSCLGGFHPRGEDSASYGTNPSSGRTLSFLTAAESANWWCRSDVRYRQSFTAPSGSAGGRIFFEALLESGVGNTHWDVPTGSFQMWGRKGCYYTAIGITNVNRNSHESPVCVYPFPLSAGCAALTADQLSAWLGRTAAEMGDCSGIPTPGDPDCDPDTDPSCPPPPRTCQTNPDDPDLNCDTLTGCVSNCVPPTVPVPPPPTPACVRHVFEIAENIVARNNAQPGLPISAQYQGRTGNRWDLQTVAPYPNTAAPNRETTDISGCPDGDETRLSHSPEADRQNVSYTDSGTRPPPAADPTVDRYDPPRRNLAHQHAGAAAAVDCAQKRAEAELYLAYIRAEAELYADTLDDNDASTATDLVSWADGVLAQMSTYTPTRSVGSGWLGQYNTDEVRELSARRTERTNRATAVKNAAVSAAATLRDAASRNWTVPATSANCFSTVISDLETSLDSAITAAVGTLAAPLSAWAAHAGAPYNQRTGYKTPTETFEKDAIPVSANTPDRSEVVGPTWNPPYCSFGYDMVGGMCSRTVASTVPVCQGGYSLNSADKCDGTRTDTESLADYIANGYSCRNGGTPSLGIVAGTIRCQVQESVDPATPRRCAPNFTLSGTDCTRTIAPNSGYYTYSGDCVWDATVDVDIEESYEDKPGTPVVAPPKISRTGTRTYTRSTTRLSVIISSGACRATPQWTSHSDVWEAWTQNPGTPGDANRPPNADPQPARYSTSHVTTTSHDPAGLASSFHIGNAEARAHLTHPSPEQRNLVFAPAVGVLPGDVAGTAWGNPDVRAKAGAYQTAYQTAYNTALNEALDHMGGDNEATWANTTWRYNPASLIWSGHTFPQPCSNDGGTVLAVSDIGLVTVAATRLDFETGQANGHPLPASCNVRRTRQPSLQVSYQNGHGTFSYTPNTAVQHQGDWPLKREYDTIALDLSLADSRPVLCWADNFGIGGHGRRTEVNVPTSAGGGLDPVGVAVRLSARRPSGMAAPASATLDGSVPPFRHFNPAIPNAHCGAVPDIQLAREVSGPEWVWFDDTAHSRMAHVWLSRAVPDCATDMTGSEILSLQTMSYNNGSRGTYSWDRRNTRNGFYGQIWGPPAGFTTSGWSGVGNPLIVPGGHLDYAVLASDKPIEGLTSAVLDTPEWCDASWQGYPPSAALDGDENISAHVLRFEFLDCLPDIRHAAYVGRITNYGTAPNSNRYDPFQGRTGRPVLNNNPYQGFGFDGIDYSLTAPGRPLEYRNWDVRSWYHPPLALFENTTQNLAPPDRNILDEDNLPGGANTTTETIVRPDTGEMPHPKRGLGRLWYIHTDRHGSRGQATGAVRYTHEDIARHLPAGCGDMQLSSSEDAVRYQSAKLGTRQTAVAGGLDEQAGLYVSVAYSRYTALNCSKTVYRIR